MPESVTDRPTKAHEYVFLLTKSGAPTYWVNSRRGTLSATPPPPDYYWINIETGEESDTLPNDGEWKRKNAWRGVDYWFDQEAVREGAADSNRSRFAAQLKHGTTKSDGLVPGSSLESSPYVGQPRYRGLPGVGTTYGSDNPAGRNIRSVWEIATQPYPEAHFATYPEELVRRCLLAGCPEWVCGTCGKPRERIVERESPPAEAFSPSQPSAVVRGVSKSSGITIPGARRHLIPAPQILGWSNCGHDNYRPGIVLDPFMGSGTTALVARKHGRHAVGVELSAEYAALCAKRLSQQSLFA